MHVATYNNVIPTNSLLNLYHDRIHRNSSSFTLNLFFLSWSFNVSDLVNIDRSEHLSLIFFIVGRKSIGSSTYSTIATQHQSPVVYLIRNSHNAKSIILSNIDHSPHHYYASVCISILPRTICSILGIHQ